jgi:hypothetical protein
VPFYIDTPFSFEVASIRIVDMDNYVYESYFRAPVTFGSTGAQAMWGLDAYLSGDISTIQDILTVSVKPISDLQEPTVIYVYLVIYKFIWYIPNTVPCMRMH